jgi:hypothetical protein
MAWSMLDMEKIDDEICENTNWTDWQKLMKIM